MAVPALLDTGSTVSTVSRHFYDEHLSSRPILPLNLIMNIECADGQPLPYDGYVEIDIESFGVEEEECYLERCIFLVIPNSPYNVSVPLLIGTNILSVFMGCTHNLCFSSELLVDMVIFWRVEPVSISSSGVRRGKRQ
jgi:hypothetical protein